MFSPRVNEPTHLFALRWIARALSIATIGFILLFLFGEGLNPSEVRPIEWLGLLFFPFGLMFGLVLGWRREFAGGLIGTGSVALFYLLYGLLIFGTIRQGWWILILSLPAVLFLVYAALRREHWNGDVDQPLIAAK